jgi:hypothetical protein
LIGGFLTLTDLTVAFFLLVGGFNATGSHPAFGFMSILLAPCLLYLTWGLWTQGEWKKVARIILYGGAFIITAISAVVLLATHSAPVDGRFVIYVAIAAFSISVALSSAHLFAYRRERTRSGAR